MDKQIENLKQKITTLKNNAPFFTQGQAIAQIRFNEKINKLQNQLKELQQKQSKKINDKMDTSKNESYNPTFRELLLGEHNWMGGPDGRREMWALKDKIQALRDKLKTERKKKKANGEKLDWGYENQILEQIKKLQEQLKGPRW